MADNVLYAKSSGNLATDVANLGSTNPWTLVIKEGTTVVSTPVTVPANIKLLKERGGVIEKTGTGTITFAGLGLADPLSREALFQGFTPGNITWTGTAPSAISTELWNTTNNSLIDRLKHADLAFPSKRVRIIAYPREIGALDQITFSEHRYIYFTQGTYTNVYTGYLTYYLPPFAFRSNFSAECEKGAILNTSNSTAGRNTAMFANYSPTAQIENVYFDNMNVQGSSTTLTSGTSCFYFGNCRNGHYRGGYLYDMVDYAVTIGGFGATNGTPNGNIAEDVEVRGVHLVRPATTPLALFNAKRCGFYDCRAFLDDLVAEANNFVLCDFEPNDLHDYLEDVEFCDNRVYVEDIDQLSGNGSYFNLFIAQAAATRGVKGLKVTGNSLHGNKIGWTADKRVPTGIDVYGVENVEINNNTINGVYGLPLRLLQCRYGTAKNNTMINCGGHTSDGSLLIEACADLDVDSNVITAGVEGHTNTNPAIIEREVSHQMDFSGTELEMTRNYAETPYLYRLYDHYVGLTLNINGADYEVATVTSELLHQKLTTTTSIGTPTGKTFTADAGTNVITFSPDPKFTTGDRVTPTNSGGGLPGGLTSGTTYYYIRLTSTTGKLATTFDNAVANNAIDLTSAGTGTHTLTPRYLSRKSALSSDVNTGTESLALLGHNHVTGARARYTAKGLVPAPLVGGNSVDYYIINQTTNTFQVSATPGGSAVTLTDGGSGTHTVTRNDGIIIGTFTSANVSGNTITINAHGQSNGTIARFSSVGTAIGGLTDGSEYFVIASADSIKFATSEANADAGTAINLTSAGAGLHVIEPIARTKFSSNRFVNNHAPGGVELEETGTSVNYERFSSTAPFGSLPSVSSTTFNPGDSLKTQLARIRLFMEQNTDPPEWHTGRFYHFKAEDIAEDYNNGDYVEFLPNSIAGQTFEFEQSTLVLRGRFYASGENGRPYVRVTVGEGYFPNEAFPSVASGFALGIVGRSSPEVDSGHYTAGFNNNTDSGAASYDAAWALSFSYNNNLRWNNSGVIVSQTANRTDLQVILAATDGTESTIYRNGTEIGTSGALLGKPAQLNIGHPWANMGWGGGIDIYELVMWNADLSEDAITAFNSDMTEGNNIG